MLLRRCRSRGHARHSRRQRPFLRRAHAVSIGWQGRDSESAASSVNAARFHPARALLHRSANIGRLGHHPRSRRKRAILLLDPVRPGRQCRTNAAEPALSGGPSRHASKHEFRNLGLLPCPLTASIGRWIVRIRFALVATSIAGWRVPSTTRRPRHRDSSPWWARAPASTRKGRRSARVSARAC